ncbi:MAG: hypothetical protein KBD26_00335 [Candidatus Pacebacteria bacterium]|nr:hypothetical protein [Candidatus Paceibacterota bacterium]MBP9772262.1 hypothetical protein [Candidatus Paceibacterota bacterium]
MENGSYSSFGQNQTENLEKNFSEIESNLLRIYSLLNNPEKIVSDKIFDTRLEIEKAVNNIHSIDINKILSNQNHRMETIRYINSIYTQIPTFGYSPEYDQNLEEIYRHIGTIVHGLQEDLYKNSDRYDFDNIDIKLDRIGNPVLVANDLFSFFSMIERYGGGMANYMDLAEKALFNYRDNISTAFYHYSDDPGGTAFLLVRMYQKEGGGAKEKIDAFLEEEIKKSNYITFENILRRESRTSVEKKVFELLNNLFEKEFGITKKGFAEGLNYQYGSIRENLDEMSLVENVYPGGVKELNEKYNIHEFRRYSYDMLVSQLDHQEDQAPYGLVIFPRSDYNGAFNHIGNSLYNVFLDTKNKHLMRIYEASSKYDVARIFLECDKKYGEQNKVSYLILGGHGQRELLNLGSHVAPHVGKSNKNYIFKHDFLGKGVKKVEKFFVEKPTIALISCSTGADKGLIDNFSRTYNAEVVAPKIPTSVKDMKARYDKTGQVHLDIEWTDENANSLYVSGENKN